MVRGSFIAQPTNNHYTRQMPTLLDPSLEKTFAEDKKYLEATKLPIITVSASFKEDLKRLHGLPDEEWLPDVVMSRAHYSMALGIATQAWGKNVDYRQAWIFDPTNYVSNKDWKSIRLTEFIGKTLARQPLLKMLKDFVDKFGRNKLPILESITPPLLHITRGLNKPILSLHIAAGNILAQHGKTIVQVITDPHVREDYLNEAERKNISFCVFDEATKLEFLEKAAFLDKKVDPEKVVVTGPPVDPRIIAARKGKHAWRNGPMKLCLTTGGLGTNKYEMRQVIRQLLPELTKKTPIFELMVYAGTQQDIFEMARELTSEAGLQPTIIIDQDQQINPAKLGKVTLIYHPQIVDANELLIKYGFPWADGFISKPSGDMAYDAVAAGCFLLTLQEWGVWEHNIEKIFEQKGIAREAEAEHILDQLQVLMSTQGKAESWMEQAMNKALGIDTLFLSGAKNIITAYQAVK